LAPSNGPKTVSSVIFILFLKMEAEPAFETMAVLDRQKTTARHICSIPIYIQQDAT